MSLLSVTVQVAIPYEDVSKVESQPYIVISPDTIENAEQLVFTAEISFLQANVIWSV